MNYAINIVERTEQPAAVVCGHVALADMPTFMGSAFQDTMAAMTAQHRFPVGPPFGRFRMAEDGFDVEAGFPASGPVTESGRVEPSALPAGQVATTMHVGPYDGVAEAYGAVSTWLESEGYHVTGAPWESYLDEPDVPNPRTEICFPCAKN